MTSPMLVPAYLDAAAGALKILSDQHVSDRWDEPSCLRGMRVAAVAGHLARSVTLTEPFLDSPIVEGEPLSAAEYYLAGGDHADLDTRANRRIRETAEEAAAGGPEAVRLAVADALSRLRDRLPTERAEDSHIWFGRLTTVATMLEARLLEIVVHCDDLATSIGIEPPALPPHAFDVTISTLVEMARRRHSDLAVVRALCRRERDEFDALRVM